jgi:hypothetical protein
VDGVEPRIGGLLEAYRSVPATVIAERIGRDRSVRVLRDRVAELRPAVPRVLVRDGEGAIGRWRAGLAVADTRPRRALGCAPAGRITRRRCWRCGRSPRRLGGAY